MREIPNPQPSSFCTVIAACMFLFACSLVASAKSVTVDCSGQTPGAFTAIQPAIDSLDVIGPNQVVIVPGAPCSANVIIADRQRLTISSASGTVAVSSAAGFAGDTFTIQGSTAIILRNLDVSGGFRGIVISRNSEVTIQGSSVSGNRANGIQMDGRSNLVLTANVHDNGAVGVSMSDSLIKAVSSQFSNNVIAGLSLTRSQGSFQNATVNNNGNGIIFGNSSAGQFTAPNLIQNNGSIGINVGDGCSVRMIGLPTNPPLSNVVEGNSFIGIGIFAGQVSLFNSNIIRNNGGGGEPFNAGVRVDDNAAFLAFGSGDIQITGNTGAGIDSSAGGDVDLAGTVITSNGGDGIRGLGQVHIIFFPGVNPNTVSGNGGRSITCDKSSVFVGDQMGVKDIHCEISPVISPGTQMRHKHMHDSDDD